MPKRIGLLSVIWIACWVGPALAQAALGRAKEMLQDLAQERSEATQTGQEAKFTPAYINARLSEIEVSVNSGILSLLNRTPTVRALEVQQELRDLQERDDTVGVFSCGTGSQTFYIVGYALIGAITSSRSWIGAFGSGPEDGSFKLLASVDNSLPDKTLALQRLSCDADTGNTFLAYGVNWGDAHSRLTVIAYSFGGNVLRSVWSRRDLPEGRLTIEHGTIVLNFMSSLTPPWVELQESYQLTPKGIEPLRKTDDPPVARTRWLTPGISPELANAVSVWLGRTTNFHNSLREEL
ncbi:MAG TPA: hypothetical protein VIX19_13790 [Terriglobales bacterium]